MPTPFDLLSEAWLPVRDARGVVSWRSVPALLADRDPAGPVAFAWGRPDLDGACAELLIGLLAVAFPSLPHGWSNLWTARPSDGDVAAALAPFASAFTLDGDGPRFQQDLAPLAGDPRPASALFIDAPGDNTVELNKDLFVKRDARRGMDGVLSRAAAAVALHALQTFAPSGGQGHRTSLRGGGPMTTLAVPRGRDGGAATLADVLWFNLPLGARSAPVAERCFPWLAPTRTSQKGGRETTPEDVDPLQVFFGMPRRIRLVFAPNEARRACDVTGTIDEVVVTGFVTTNFGTNYTGPWRHPLSPYQAGKGGEALPLHPQPGGVSYPQWLGLAASRTMEGRMPAPVITAAYERALDLGWAGGELGIAVHGYDMDNMKARGFVEQELPLFVAATPEEALARDTRARDMVEAADIVRLALRRAILLSRHDPKRLKDARDDLSVWAERLIADTEADFYAALRPDGGGDAQARVAFHEALRDAANRLFAEATDIDALDDIDRAMRVLAGRRVLAATLAGRSKDGAKLFQVLGFPPPDPPQSKKPRTKGAAR